jgi:DNA polymerase-3 subunit alpha
MCGALDAFAERNELLHNTDSILDFHKDVVKTNANQDSLFAIDSFSSFVMKKTNPADQKTKLTWEKELLGLFVSGFPLDPWKEKINARGITVDKIHSEYKDGKEISLAVIIENIKVTVTKKGDKMGLLRLRDYTGTIEVAVFPEAYKRFKSNILNDVPLLVKGKVSTRNNDKTMILDEIKILDQSS